MAGKNTSIEVKQEGKGEMAPSFDWEPMRVLRQQFDRLLQDFDWPDFRFARPSRALSFPNLMPDMEAALPAVDLIEHNGGYDLTMEIPGLARDQIEVKIADGMLSIHGEKSAETVDEGANYRLQERSYGAVSRTFRLPPGIDDKQVTAKLENGVLKVHLPKSPEAIAKESKIEVTAA